MSPTKNKLEEQLASQLNSLDPLAGDLALGADFAYLPTAWPLSPYQAWYRHNTENFLVIEELGFQPSGHGEHLYLFIEKNNLSTGKVVEDLAQGLKINARNIGFSGLKDRYAVARQWFSIPWATTAPPVEIKADKWQVLEQVRHSRKLKRGTHKSNRFTLKIEITNANANTANWLNERWQLISAQGVPNYFGPQRFGIHSSNLHRGLQFLQQTRGAKPKKNQLSLYISALRSALFNLYLAQDLTKQTWLEPLASKVYNLAGSNSFFSDANATNLADRLNSLDIHPAAPLAGRGAFKSTGTTLQLEEQFKQNYAFVWQLLEQQGLSLDYRSLRLQPQAPELIWHAPWLELSFSLPSGCFATSLLRELIQAEDIQLAPNPNNLTSS